MINIWPLGLDDFTFVLCKLAVDNLTLIKCESITTKDLRPNRGPKASLTPNRPDLNIELLPLGAPNWATSTAQKSVVPDWTPGLTLRLE